MQAADEVNHGHALYPRGVSCARPKTGHKTTINKKQMYDEKASTLSYIYMSKI